MTHDSYFFQQTQNIEPLHKSPPHTSPLAPTSPSFGRIIFYGNLDAHSAAETPFIEWRSRERLDDGAPDRRQSRSRRSPMDSFFPFRGGGGADVAGRRRRSWSSAHACAGLGPDRPSKGSRPGSSFICGWAFAQTRRALTAAARLFRVVIPRTIDLLHDHFLTTV